MPETEPQPQIIESTLNGADVVVTRYPLLITIEGNDEDRAKLEQVVNRLQTPEPEDPAYEDIWTVGFGSIAKVDLDDKKSLISVWPNGDIYAKNFNEKVIPELKRLGYLPDEID